MSSRRTKRPKRKRVELIPDAEVSSDDDEEEFDDHEIDATTATRRFAKGKAAKREEGGYKTDILEVPDSVIEENLGFCCAVCHCGDERRSKIPLDDLYIQRGDDVMYHRRCCHGVFSIEDQEEWAPQYLGACSEYGDYIMGEAELDDCPQVSTTQREWITRENIVERYKNSEWRQYAFEYGNHRLPHPASVLSTSEQYQNGVCLPFRKLKEERSKAQGRPGLTVLSAFGGIGTDQVVLKRLGLKIDKIVHIEMDKVSTHVTRYNHDRDYNSDLPEDGGIQHVFIETYEEFALLFKEAIESEEEDDFDAFTFDLIIGGPPCQDFSKVNAFRSGVEGDRGKYMVQFLHLIREIERRQERPLFFLVENVVLSGDDLEAVRDASGFEFDPITIDAACFSPCCRKRHFITNIPLDESSFDFDPFYNELVHCPPSTCLEPGYNLASFYVDDKLTVKANTFMASKSRIDPKHSLAMYVWKKRKNHRFHGRPITASEREAMMGYPKDYVCKPVKALFTHLLENGHAMCYMSSEDNNWRNGLDSKYRGFIGNFHKHPEGQSYSFAVEKEMVGEPKKKAETPTFEPKITMCMSQPSDGSSKAEFFDQEEYAKRMIGLAFSVPVVEQFLRPLKYVFAQRVYEGYTNVPYKWEEDSKPAATS